MSGNKSREIATATDCRTEFERMLKNSQTKVIMPVLGLALLRQFLATRRTVFADSEIKTAYSAAVRSLKDYLGHDVHVGAKYEDAYGMRMSRYSMLRSVGHLRYEITRPFRDHAMELEAWLPDRIKQHIGARIGIIPQLAEAKTRLALARDRGVFVGLIEEQIERNATTFEIVSFALIKVHLERFACKIYRDTRTSAHDRGVDLATNFGVVYQVKKLRIESRADADRLLAELQTNFDAERLQDGNVILEPIPKPL